MPHNHELGNPFCATYFTPMQGTRFRKGQVENSEKTGVQNNKNTIDAKC